MKDNKLIVAALIIVVLIVMFVVALFLIPSESPTGSIAGFTNFTAP